MCSIVPVYRHILACKVITASFSQIDKDEKKLLFQLVRIAAQDSTNAILLFLIVRNKHRYSSEYILSHTWLKHSLMVTAISTKDLKTLWALATLRRTLQQNIILMITPLPLLLQSFHNYPCLLGIIKATSFLPAIKFWDQNCDVKLYDHMGLLF